MKQVILMRHAKSSWEDYSLTDHQRGLNERGKSDSPIIANEIKKRGILPQVVYSSDSTRTRETFKLIDKVLNTKESHFHSTLYMASEEDILETIQGADDTADTILILAHNPGITDAFDYLANVFIDNVPTCGAGCLQFDVNSFEDIEIGTGKLVYFIYPKML